MRFDSIPEEVPEEDCEDDYNEDVSKHQGRTKMRIACGTV